MIPTVTRLLDALPTDASDINSVKHAIERSSASQLAIHALPNEAVSDTTTSGALTWVRKRSSTDDTMAFPCIVFELSGSDILRPRLTLMRMTPFEETGSG